MTIPSRELKRRARSVLEGKYFFAANTACTLMLYSFFVTLILQYSGLAASEKPMGIVFYYTLWIIMALLGSLLEVGLIRYVYLLSRKEKTPHSPALFYAYRNQPDTFILVYAFRYLVALVWFIPAIWEVRKLPLNLEPLALIRALFPIILLVLAAILPALLVSLPYGLACYVLLDQPYCLAHEALGTSRRLMKGNYMRLFRLWLSFLPFILLIIGTSGVAILWVKPYFHTTMSQFYMEISHQKLPEEPQISIVV
ncbi:MAG: DUF975 family protein [Lachnospiraceae bacterium]|jgi:uncharacterized membrane protein|uniref:DUF975 family protein n=1 Tax=Candidatus Merdisoma sp. JLR.KK006 TaxID=3112626 RepID=UPI002FF3AAE7|nr:DUF975 family protein [Lachnospiraceae bacterium]